MDPFPPVVATRISLDVTHRIERYNAWLQAEHALDAAAGLKYQQNQLNHRTSEVAQKALLVYTSAL